MKTKGKLAARKGASADIPNCGKFAALGLLTWAGKTVVDYTPETPYRMTFEIGLSY